MSELLHCAISQLDRWFFSFLCW